MIWPSGERQYGPPTPQLGRGEEEDVKYITAQMNPTAAIIVIDYCKPSLLQWLCAFCIYFRQNDKSLQTDGSPVSLYNNFIQKVRDQLHIVLTMSPVGDSFRNRLRKFPSLVNCCTIDWFKVFSVSYVEEVQWILLSSVSLFPHCILSSDWNPFEYLPSWIFQLLCQIS